MRQVEKALKEGQVDAEFEANRGRRQEAIDALTRAEHVDPEKLRRRMNI